MPELADEPLQVTADTAPTAFSFAVLGQPAAPHVDSDIDVQVRRDAHWSARKACAMLKTTAAIVNAVVVHPGGDCDDKQLAESTRELMGRAVRLTNAAMELMGLSPEHPKYAGYRTLLRQQAAEVVATQWRMAHGTGGSELTADRIADIFKTVLSDEQFASNGETLGHPADVDYVTAKRVAVLGVAPDIYNAVNSFDYFCPNPETLVDKGVRKVIEAADAGVGRLASPGASRDTVTMLTQSLIGKAGALYAANYRANARRDVLFLQRLDPLERKRTIYASRHDGLPTAHVDESFGKLMNRMVDMVCEAVPELAAGAAPEVARAGNERSERHDYKPD